MNNAQIKIAQAYYRDTFGDELDDHAIKTMRDINSPEELDEDYSDKLSNGEYDAADWAFFKTN